MGGTSSSVPDKPQGRGSRAAARGTAATRGTGSSTTDAIAQTARNVELLEKREALLTKQMDELMVKAKEKKAKNDTNGALHYMKMRKQKEEERMRLQKMKANLETQRSALESASANTVIVDQYRANTAALRQAQLDPEQVSDIMDDVMEAMDEQREVGEALAQELPTGVNADDDELLGELNESIEAEQAAAEAADTSGARAAPAAAAAPRKSAADLARERAEAELAALTITDSPIRPAATATTTAATTAAAPARRPVAAGSSDEEMLRQLEASMSH